MANDFLTIGFTEKPHGINGEIKLRIDAAYLDELAALTTLYIDLKGKPTPYFIEELRGGSKIIAKLEDIDTREDALALGSQAILVKATDLQTVTTEPRSLLHFAKLVGYTLIDKTQGNIGIIEEIIEMPMQEMAALQYKTREILVPLNAQLITAIDPAQKMLHVDLPEGLLEL